MIWPIQGVLSKIRVLQAQNLGFNEDLFGLKAVAFMVQKVNLDPKWELTATAVTA